MYLCVQTCALCTHIPNKTNGIRCHQNFTVPSADCSALQCPCLQVSAADIQTLLLPAAALVLGTHMFESVSTYSIMDFSHFLLIVHKIKTDHVAQMDHESIPQKAMCDWNSLDILSRSKRIPKSPADISCC